MLLINLQYNKNLISSTPFSAIF